MTDPVQMVCTLTGCTQEEAEKVLNDTEDVVEAVDRLLVKKPSNADKYLSEKKRSRELTPEEQIVSKFRPTLQQFDKLVSTSLYQPVREELNETQVLHEETAQQNSYSQECQLPSLQSEVETQGTACPSLSGCSCGSPSSGQTPHGSGPQCPQSCQVQGTASSQTGGQTPA